ncbi:LysR family transcriptional regulator [Pseudomonas sp. IT-347P]
MMATTLDIDLLRTFHAVVRLGKFSGAAQALHKSPAAVSVHVQRLETLAGGRLLHRDNQGVTLTPLGERLLKSTVDLLHTHDRVLAQLQGAQLNGQITLGVPDEYAAHVIRDILPGFTAAWPNVVLRVLTAPSYTLSDWVQRGKVQMALVSRPRASRPDVEVATQAQVLAVTTPVWVAGTAGPTPTFSQTSAPLPLALYADDCPYRRAMLDTLRAKGRTWRVVLDSPSTQAVRACVEAGLGIGLIDREAITAQMQVLEDFPPVGEHEVVLARAVSTPNDEAIELLTQSLHRHFRL